MDMLPKSPLFSKFGGSTLYLGLVVVLVGVGGFGLGRLSALESQKQNLHIYAPQPAAVGEAARVLAVPSDAPVRPTPAPNQPKNFVASKNGTKYYTAGCPGAARIKAENQVWFSSQDNAEAAGYTLAANCAIPTTH